MSALDLTEARAAGEAAWTRSYFSGAPSRVARDAYLAAAAPLIARMVADSIAEAILAERLPALPYDGSPEWAIREGARDFLAIAAEIAREWSPA